MKRFQKILVATDTEYQDHPIVDEAVDIALHSDASLTIVDVVRTFTWMEKLSRSKQKSTREEIGQAKGEKLDAIVQSIRRRGLEVEGRVLYGTTSTEIIREVQRGGHDLVMRITKGRRSVESSYFGSTSTQLLRRCPCSVWLVTSEPSRFDHVLGCVDTSIHIVADEQLNDRIYEVAKEISQFHDGRFSIAHVWSVLIEPILKARIPAGEFAQCEREHEQIAAKDFETFLLRHGSHLGAPEAQLLHGDLNLSIRDFIKDNGVDLVVVGNHSKPATLRWVMGGRAEDAFAKTGCSVLALRDSAPEPDDPTP